MSLMRTVSIPIGAGVDGTDGSGTENTLPTEWQGKIKRFEAVEVLQFAAANVAWTTPGTIDAIADYPDTGADATVAHFAYNGNDKLKMGYKFDIAGAVQVILLATVVVEGGIQGYGDGT